MFQDPSQNTRNGEHDPEPSSGSINEAYQYFLNMSKDGVRYPTSKPQFIGKAGLGRQVVDTLARFLSNNLPEGLLETHQLRLLNPHTQPVVINQEGEGGAHVVRFSYMAMVEIYQPGEAGSYALRASKDDAFLFESPVAHFLHFLDKDSMLLSDEPFPMPWSVQPAFSPEAFHEAIDTFENLKSSETDFLGDFLREELCNLLEYDDPSDPRLDERCQITKREDRSLEMHFDGKLISGFAINLHPQLLNPRCQFPTSFIEHVERTREG